jgi:hypothetical protein
LIGFFLKVPVTGAAQRQFRFVLFQRLLIVAVQTAAVHGILVSGSLHIENSLSISRNHSFMAILANLRRQFGVLQVMALLTAFISAQLLLVETVIEDRNGLMIICVAFPAGCHFIFRQVQVVAEMAIAFSSAFVYQTVLVVQVGEVHHVP